MNKRKLLIGVTLVFVAGLLLWWKTSNDAPVFPQLEGPLHSSTVAAPVPTMLTDYPGSGPHSIAIWVNDPASSWLGLALGLKSMGLPFRFVSDIEQALEHNVIMVYPSLTGRNTAPAALESLRAHVERGGTLVGFSVIGGGMSSVFGFEQSEEHRLRRSIEFSPSALTEGLIEEPAAREQRLGSATDAEAGLPGTHYLGFAEAVARYEDGSAAVTYQSHSSDVEGKMGHAYAFGMDLGHFMMRSFNGRFSSLADTYVNAYQPQVDTWLRLLQRIYEQGEPHGVTISPTPHGRDFTALLTHDVDFTRSINNIPEYVALAERYGVPATYFIQTKYITDFNDRRFFDPSRQAVMQLLLDNGMEIASHTVAHSNEFSRMPVGSGDEQYPTYRPFVRDFRSVENASMLGELRVSKFLLESLSGHEVVSFRPGHLSLPDALPELLEATGYRFSSSMTANEAMTHLPYRLTYGRAYGSQVDAFEFPVTVEDEQGNINQRFAEIVTLSNQIAEYQGLVTLMVHTDETGEKLQFVERYLREFKDTAWFDTVSGYGNWWAARESVVLHIIEADADSVQLRISSAQSIDGLTLRVPDSWHYRDGLDHTQQNGMQVVLGPLTGQATLTFNISG